MVATAALSHRPWLPEVPFDEVEDALHSLIMTRAFTGTKEGGA